MLSLEAGDVHSEITAAEDLRKKHLQNCAVLIRKYVGNWYRNDIRGKPVPENLIFTYVATTLPAIVFDNPAVTCSPKRIITHAAIAKFMEMGINSWIKEVKLTDELEQAALDFLFSFGCLKVGIEPRSDFSAGQPNGVQERMTMDALTPYMVRIPPSAVIIDSQASSIASARLLGHMFQRDKKDLEKDDRYDQSVVRRITADDDSFPGKFKDERAMPRNRTDPMRDRVTLYELYFPEYKQIGTLACYGDGQKAWIRKLADYHGPAEGPFQIFGGYVVPDQAYPLPPIAAFAEQVQELNSHATAAAKEAASAKKIVLVDANHPDMQRAIQQGENGGVIPIRGLNATNALPLELGGASKERLEYMQLLLTRCDRVAGQSDAIRGKPANVTATEATIVDASADARSDYMHKKYREGVKRALSNVGWYLFHDPSVVMPVSMNDPTTQQPFEGLFLGGIQPGQEDMNWSDIFLDIEPYSMKRVDPAVEQQRAQMMIALVTQLAPMIVQFPFINWPNLLDMIGEANNLPDFAQQIFNAQGLQMIGQGGNQVAGPGQLVGAGPAAQQALPPGAGQGVQMGAGGAPVGGMPQTVPGQPIAHAAPNPQQAVMNPMGGAPRASMASGTPGGIQQWMSRLEDKTLALSAMKQQGITPQMPAVGGTFVPPAPKK